MRGVRIRIAVVAVVTIAALAVLPPARLVDQRDRLLGSESHRSGELGLRPAAASGTVNTRLQLPAGSGPCPPSRAVPLLSFRDSLLDAAGKRTTPCNLLCSLGFAGVWKNFGM